MSAEKIKVVKPLPKVNQLMHDLGLLNANKANIQTINKKIKDLDRQFDLGKQTVKSHVIL